MNQIGGCSSSGSSIGISFLRTIWMLLGVCTLLLMVDDADSTDDRARQKYRVGGGPYGGEGGGDGVPLEVIVAVVVVAVIVIVSVIVYYCCKLGNCK